MVKFLFPLYETPGDGGSGGGDDLAQDLKDLEDTETPSDKPEKDEKEEEEEDDDFLIKEEPEDEEEEDERPERKPEQREGDEEEEEEAEEESTEIERDETGRPTVKSIKAKYPNVFKDFPELKRAFFISRKYEEVFADPQQAIEAVEKSKEFDDLESDIVNNGSPRLLIRTLSENNPKALKKFLSNLAGSIREEYEDGYLDLAKPILEELCYTAFQHGNKTGNKNLSISARHIANFIWNNGGEIPDISRRPGKEPSEAERELARERSENQKERFLSAVQSIVPTIEAQLRQYIVSDLKGLTDFERKAILKDTKREVDEALKNDRAFQTQLDRLWERARAENYSDSSKERVKSAWLSRARQVAPAIKNRLRKEALDARRSVGRNQEDVQRKRTFPGQGGREARAKGQRVLDPKKIDWAKTSDMDILNTK